MKLNNLKNSLRKRILENKGLMGMVTLFLLMRGWHHMLEKDGLWFFGLIIFSIGFFNCIPIVLQIIEKPEKDA